VAGSAEERAARVEQLAAVDVEFRHALQDPAVDVTPPLAS